jgi:hypothetical protein
MGVACDTLFIAERLFEGLAKRNADIFNRVVLINLKVAFATDRDIEQSVAGQKRQHMIQKTNTAGDLCFTGSIERDAHRNIGFAGLPFDGC